MMRRMILTVVLLAVLPFAALAVEPGEMLGDPALEARAREVSKELRCVVCQNQDIDSSNAGVARDLRILVRERLIAGDTNEAVLTYIRARYGDYVLMKPPFKPETYVLWLAPIALILIGAGVVFVVLSNGNRRRIAAPLSAKEEQEVTDLLAQNDRTLP